MSVNLTLLIAVGVMAACGAYLLMERSLVRMLLGLLLCGNAVNLLIITVADGFGNPPIMGQSSEANTSESDPLSHAMILTAIVITMGIAAFVLSLVYRLFVINRDDDEVTDDTEDVKILTSSIYDAPDRDRSDDPVTLADTEAGDLFDDEGNPLTQEEWDELQIRVKETDLMPLDDDVIDEMDDSETESSGDTDSSDTPDTPSGGPR